MLILVDPAHVPDPKPLQGEPLAARLALELLLAVVSSTSGLLPYLLLDLLLQESLEFRIVHLGYEVGVTLFAPTFPLQPTYDF